MFEFGVNRTGPWTLQSSPRKYFVLGRTKLHSGIFFFLRNGIEDDCDPNKPLELVLTVAMRLAMNVFQAVARAVVEKAVMLESRISLENVDQVETVDGCFRSHTTRCVATRTIYSALQSPS